MAPTKPSQYTQSSIDVVVLQNQALHIGIVVYNISLVMSGVNAATKRYRKLATEFSVKLSLPILGLSVISMVNDKHLFERSQCYHFTVVMTNFTKPHSAIILDSSLSKRKLSKGIIVSLSISNKQSLIWRASTKSSSGKSESGIMSNK